MGLLDAVGYVGDSLDKMGARPLRGVLGGKPREALSFVPFSDRIGVTDPRDIVSGRHLTDQAGLTSRGDHGWGASAIGFGAEMALDPMNLVGGLGAARKLAKGFRSGAALGHGDDLARGLAKNSDFSLGLKYDDLVTPPHGMPRSDPEWVNNRTFYHGTATHGLSPEILDPRKTDPKALFGRGIYTTDEGGRSILDPSITSGYAGHRARDAYLDLVSRRSPYDEPPVGPKPIIYQGQSDFGKIIDVHSPLDTSILPPLRDYAKWMDASQRKLLKFPGADSVPQIGDMRASLDSLTRTAKHSPVNNEAVLKTILRGQQSLAKMAETVSGHGGVTSGIEPEIGNGLIRALTGQGYDALTHTGGVRGGREHQVVIGLDPNDVLGTGHKAPYKAWEPFASPFDSDTDFSLHPASPTRNMAVDPWHGNAERALIEAATALGPQYPAGLRTLERIKDSVSGQASWHIRDLLDSPFASRIASEFPPDARFLSAGAQGFAAQSGDSVIRAAKRLDQITRRYSNTEYGRANIPEMLQPVRSVNIGDYRVERLPLVDPALQGDRHGIRSFLAKPGHEASADAHAATIEGAATSLADALTSRVNREHGLHAWDVADNRTNVSFTNEGRGIIHDPGAVWTFNPRTLPSDAPVPPARIAPPPDIAYPSPTEIEHLLARGSPEEVQRAIRRGLDQGTRRQGIDMAELGLDPALSMQSSEARARLAELISQSRQGPQPVTLPLATPAHDALINALNSQFSLAPSAIPNVAAGSGSGGLNPRFKDLREQFYMLKGVKPGADVPRRTQGSYTPRLRGGAVYEGARNPGSTTRHEVGHGLVQAAINAGPGSIASLPAAWQPGAWAQYAGGRRSGLGKFGRYLDEIGQHSTQHRGLMNQVRGGVNFATDRGIASRYAVGFADENPLVRALIMTPPWANENRAAIGLGALGAADLARLTAMMQREQ